MRTAGAADSASPRWPPCWPPASRGPRSRRPRESLPAAGAAHPSFAALYGRVFENPKAIWLYAAVVAEGALIFGAFRSSANC
jgi:hypothetical protein